MSVRNPYKKQNEFKTIKEEQSHNRSTLYHYFNDNGMQIRFMKIGKGTYKVFTPDYKWDSVYLTVNGVRFTDFQAVILFSNELVVRFGDIYNNSQVNIPYRIIKTIQLDNDLDIGYEELHLNK